MKTSTRIDARSPPSFLRPTRAAATWATDMTQPPLRSGFGEVLMGEHDLQAATTACIETLDGPRAAALARILRHQHSLLGANIALLEQRYEAVPHSTRFQVLRHDENPVSAIEAPVPEKQALPDLVAQHVRLTEDIGALIYGGSDGQRGELILSQVERNHDDMIWMLTALINEDQGRIAAVPTQARSMTWQAEQSWDNEGGLSSVSSAAESRTLLVLARQ